METNQQTQTRVRARDAAFRLLNRLTAAVAVAGFAGVAIFSAVSAATIPGKSISSTQTASSNAGTSSGSSTSSNSSSSASASSSSDDLQPSAGVSPAPSGSGTAVSGGS